MKLTMGACLLVLAIAGAAASQQDSRKPVLRQGVSVTMPISNQATEMRAADDENATVVVVTAGGDLFLGPRPLQVTDLSKLDAQTVYVKADARAPYQTILRLFDGLRGRSIILLTASTSNHEVGTIVPPYGVKVTLDNSRSHKGGRRDVF